MENRLWIGMLTLTASLSLMGCAGLTQALNGQTTNGQILTHTAIKFATIKAVEKSQNPKALAEKVRTALDQVDAYLAGSESVSIDSLNLKVEGIIGSKLTDPADKLAADAVWQIVLSDLQGKITATGGRILTADQITALKAAGADIRGGLILAGY